MEYSAAENFNTMTFEKRKLIKIVECGGAFWRKPGIIQILFDLVFAHMEINVVNIIVIAGRKSEVKV